MANTEATALGVDVGGARKGFDLVLMSESCAILAHQSRVQVADLSSFITSWQPDVVAIDSPQAWAVDRERDTERFLRGIGINLYQTPWMAEKKSHPFYAWMLMGFEAFRASVDAGYRFFDGTSSVNGYCIEVFPHATEVVLAGGMRPPSIQKSAWRREVLTSQRVDTRTLRGPDQVDAALAALTGVLALSGSFCWRGNPAEGVIVLPCASEDLRAHYRLPVEDELLVQGQVPQARATYPDRSTRLLSKTEKAEIRSRLLEGEADSYALAAEFGCAVVQITGIKAAITLANGRRPDR